MLTLDLARNMGQVSPLHGVNLGPVDRRWARDYSEAFRRVAIPSVRLHDASLAQGEVVDLHCVFPDPKADPDDPESYSFALTDKYVAAIRESGAEVYFRLGESIEHCPDKLFIRPERWTPARMARVCANIVRHYNHGWADGYEWDIRYWEFWNEPDNTWNRPRDQRICWTGSVDEFFEFYRAAVAEIKQASPSVSVGLAGFTVRFTRAWLEAGVDDRDDCAGWVGLIPRCVEAALPIDFVSWHMYSGSWSELGDMAVGVRRRLDALGLDDAESHLTEWNYIPTLRDEAGEYTYMNTRMKGDFERYERAEAVLNGPEGAAFTFGTFALLQDVQVDRAHFYTGVSEPWGLFRLSGRPMAKYLAFEAFAEFLGDGAQRVPVASSDGERMRGLAVVDGSRLKIGVANLDRNASEVRLTLNGLPGSATIDTARRLDTDRWQSASVSIVDGGVTMPISGPGISIIDIRM